jgi:hypothetical protein
MTKPSAKLGRKAAQFWPLSESQTMAINEAGVVVERAQEEFRRRTAVALGELAKAKGLEPAKVRARLTNHDGKACFHVESTG